MGRGRRRIRKAKAGTNEVSRSFYSASLFVPEELLSRHISCPSKKATLTEDKPLPELEDPIHYDCVGHRAIGNSRVLGFQILRFPITHICSINSSRLIRVQCSVVLISKRNLNANDAIVLYGSNQG